jgi:hypothetical protein
MFRDVAHHQQKRVTEKRRSHMRPAFDIRIVKAQPVRPASAEPDLAAKEQKQPEHGYEHDGTSTYAEAAPHEIERFSFFVSSIGSDLIFFCPNASRFRRGPRRNVYGIPSTSILAMTRPSSTHSSRFRFDIVR